MSEQVSEQTGNVEAETVRMDNEARIRELNLGRLKAVVQDHTPARLAAAYVTLRAKKTAIEKEMKARLTPISEQMDIIGEELMKRLDEMDALSIRTPLGTPYITTQQVGKIMDWETLAKFIVKNKVPGVLQGRLALSEVSSWNEVHPTNPVPGIQLSQVRSLRVKGS